jgi:hypothetical protein
MTEIYQKWKFPQYTKVKTAVLYIMSEYNGHFLEYFPWFLDSKPEGPAPETKKVGFSNFS